RGRHPEPGRVDAGATHRPHRRRARGAGPDPRGALPGRLARLTCCTQAARGASAQQLRELGRLLAPNVLAEEAQRDLVPDLGVLRLEDPVVLVGEVEEA